jgi:hypothetical protein
MFLVCSMAGMSFKVVRLKPGGQEVIVRAGNYEFCKAAFDTALFIYPGQHMELRRVRASSASRRKTDQLPRGRLDVPFRRESDLYFGM